MSTIDALKLALSGRYAIMRELGRGGMATVYLAQDLKHGRQVAIKVLNPELAASVGSERFLREIEIAAQLSHPHILSLIDSGKAEGVPYYVMPFIEGESLRERLDREYQLPVEEALRLTREVADALGHAHAEGVIHRDVKPENIMLEAGHAVVADFGIARAVTAAGGAKLTETGMAIGTPAYMSPEQATGARDVDGRSDVYSLACVLYEMLSGEPPYDAPTPMALIAKKLGEPTPRISVVREAVPLGTEQALSKALSKTPADRYGTPAAFVAALDKPGALRVAERRYKRVALVAGVVMFAAAGGMGIRALTRPFVVTASNHRQVTFDPGIEIGPALSPDGNEVAYVAGYDDEKLMVQSLLAGEALSLVEDVSGVSLPVWDGDGQRVFFGGWPRRAGAASTTYQIMEVAKLGGPIRTLLRPKGYNPVTAPGGSRVGYWRPAKDSAGESVGVSLVVSTVGSGEEESEELWAIVPRGSIGSFAWSQDGERIAYVQRDPADWSDEWIFSSIWVVSKGGEAIRVTGGEHHDTSPKWLPDNRHLLFVSDRDGPRDIYLIDSEDPGEPQRVTFGGQDPRSISLSADGKRLAYSKYRFRRNIWSIPIPSSGSVSIVEGRPITNLGWGQLIEDHSLSPDGDSIVFDFRADPGGEFHIYKMDVEGGTPIQVTSAEVGDYGPVWSPSGREIAFVRDPDPVHLWVMDADGAGQRQIPDDLGGMMFFDWSPDGLSLLYERGTKGLWSVSRGSLRQGFDMPVPFGEPSLVSNVNCQLPRWSPDASAMVCNGPSTWGDHLTLFWLSPQGTIIRKWPHLPYAELQREQFAGMRGEVREPPQFWWMRYPRYSPDGSTIYFFGMDNSSGTGSGFNRGVFSMPAGGGQPRFVVDLDFPELDVWAPLRNGTRFAALSVGEEHLYLSVGDSESDIWAMDLDW